MASSEKQMIHLDAIPKGDEGMAEPLSAEDLVNVKFPSRPRRKVVIIVAVIAVVLIIAGVLIGTFVPNYLRDNDDGANNKSEKGLKGKGIGEIEEEELEEEKSIPSPLGTIEKISSSASVFPTSSSRFHLSPVEMASVTTTCKNCNDFTVMLSSSLNERASLSSMSYSIDTGPGSLSLMVLSSSLNERPSLSLMSYSIDPHTTTGPASSLSSMTKLVPNAGTIAEVLSSTSISPTSSSRFHLLPVEMASVTITCENCNDFSLLMSSSLNERPSLSSMSYSIETSPESPLSSLVSVSFSLNERPSLSSMSYSIDPHTTTGPGSSLSSIAKLVPNTEAKWSRWSSWSDCTKTCGNGTRFRTRKCVAQNQDAVFAPISCAGKHQQNKTCADWGCPDCSKICIKGTLNAACDACTCEDHVLTGRVQTKNDAPLSEAKISLAETPYNVLAQTNASGFFIAFNVCADANQELLIAREGFVPVKIKATVMTSTTASAKTKLDNAVPPSITVNPRSKMRISGHGVTFCCDGDGTPTPEFEWFKDNNIIDKDVYHYNKTLEISDVSGLKGRYRCRVVNDYGSEFSDVANLQVLNTSDEVSCNPTPISKNATLPAGCVIQGTTNDTIDVGQCSPTPCLRNDSALSNTACQDENFCCGVEEEEDVTITCGGSATLNISKVARCGCQACVVPKSYITGVVVGIKNAVEKPIAYCDVIVRDIPYGADDNGFFTLEVPDDKQRLLVVFKDTWDEEYADLTKVFRIEKGQTSFSKIVLKVKPVPKPFISSQPFNVSLGDSHGDSAFAEIEIPKNALLKEDGTIYSGQANLRLSSMDPRNASDIMTAPADFSTIDEDGEGQMLVTYGMVSLDFEDDSGNKLSTSKSIKMFLDPEKLNISIDSKGNTTTKLWWLDEKTGRWIEAGSLWMETKEASRSKRSSRRFLVTEITPVMQNKGTLNIDVKGGVGAVRVSAPAGSTVRILCKEPNESVEKYLGYLEGVTDGNGITCISTWMNKKCFMQAESSNSRFLTPEDPPYIPTSMSASIVNSSLGSVGSSPNVKSFSFYIETDNNGPVYPQSVDDTRKSCKADDTVTEGLRQFVFSSPIASINLKSKRQANNDEDSRYWWNGKNKCCFIKILIDGSSGMKAPIFLASSYRQNQTDNKNKFGDSVSTAKQIDNTDDFVACLEIRCPGDVYNEDTNTKVKEWIYVLVTHLTGTCDLTENLLSYQDDLDNDKTPGPTCPPSRKKRHAAGSENWICIPYTGTTWTPGVFDARQKTLKHGENKCYAGNNDNSVSQSGDADAKAGSPTLKFTCS